MHRFTRETYSNNRVTSQIIGQGIQIDLRSQSQGITRGSLPARWRDYDVPTMCEHASMQRRVSERHGRVKIDAVWSGVAGRGTSGVVGGGCSNASEEVSEGKGAPLTHMERLVRPQRGLRAKPKKPRLDDSPDL